MPPGLEVLADPMAVDVVHAQSASRTRFAAVAAAGGGTIALTARRVNDEIELAVRDSGVGFRPADGAELFKKFSRLHAGERQLASRHGPRPVHRQPA